MDRFIVEKKPLGKGAYGEVKEAMEIATNRSVAIKIMPAHGNTLSSLQTQEIYFLQEFNHPNIVSLVERPFFENEQVHLVFELLSSSLDYHRLCHEGAYPNCIRTIINQILNGVEHLHKNGIVHRDLKPANIFLDSNMDSHVVKVGDFGCARGFLSTDFTLTPEVCTPGYRAPEIHLGATDYSFAVDIWSIGCIFYELVMDESFIPGLDTSEEELDHIFKCMGKPNEETWPGVSSFEKYDENSPNYEPQNLDEICSCLGGVGIDLMKRMLTLNPSARITAEQALQHPYFAE